MTPSSPNDSAHELAAAARVVLENKALIRAFESLERAYFNEWQSTPSLQIDVLLAIKSRQDALSAFKADLESILMGGKIADFNSKSRLRSEFTK